MNKHYSQYPVWVCCICMSHISTPRFAFRVSCTAESSYPNLQAYLMKSQSITFAIDKNKLCGLTFTRLDAHSIPQPRGETQHLHHHWLPDSGPLHANTHSVTSPDRRLQAQDCSGISSALRAMRLPNCLQLFLHNSGPSSSYLFTSWLSRVFRSIDSLPWHIA